jgi:hypothetical protein
LTLKRFLAKYMKSKYFIELEIYIFLKYE